MDDHHVLKALSIPKTVKWIPDIWKGKLASNEQVAYYRSQRT
ncbi:hypothetical protein AB1K91_08845 [Terribacillus sp. 179-K 1B1 HS]